MDEQQEEQRIAAAFNAGYLLQKYEPALLQKIKTDANKRSEFVMYMDKGSRQYQKEVLIQQQQQANQNQRHKKRQPGR